MSGTSYIGYNSKLILSLCQEPAILAMVVNLYHLCVDEQGRRHESMTALFLHHI